NPHEDGEDRERCEHLAEQHLPSSKRVGLENVGVLEVRAQILARDQRAEEQRRSQQHAAEHESGESEGLHRWPQQPLRSDYNDRSKCKRYPGPEGTARTQQILPEKRDLRPPDAGELECWLLRGVI